MPKYIIVINDPKDNRDYYLEWSTVVDAPVSYGADINTLRKYYPKDIDNRLSRVESHGTSSRLGITTESMISHNRAGDDESCLTKEEILDKYCRCSEFYCV